jgi:chromosome segregation ATPase
MKYLKSFKLFENIEAEVTDEPDVKLAKEESNELEKHLKEYPAVKSELDKAFAEIKSDKDNELLNKRIEEIKKKFSNNPFIEEYTRMMNLQTRVKYIQDELIKYNDELFKNEEDLKVLTNSKGDTSQKLKTINDIKSKQKLKTKEIADIKKDLIEAQTGLKSKIGEIKDEIVDSSKKIASI